MVRPRVSVLVRVADGDEAGLARSLDALRRLRAPRWEMVAATTPALHTALRARGGRRLRVVEVSATCGQAEAWQAALARAEGEFVVLLAPGDRLVPETLMRTVRRLGRVPTTDLCYADEVRVSADGRRHGYLLRPAWSPDYLASTLYVDRAFVVRRRAIEAVGGFRRAFDPAPEWDLVLRLAERGPLAHLCAVLLERPGEPGDPWRADSAALVDAGRRVLEEACRRRGVGATVEALPLAGTYRVRRAVPADASVSFVVPFRDGPAFLERCVESVLREPRPPRSEIVLVDNGSVRPETAALLRRLCTEPAVRCVAAPGPFNFSRLVNVGVAASQGAVVCLLNSDVEARGDGWLGALLEHAVRPEVGAVGAKLLYPDGSIQHAGVVLGGPAGPDHILRFEPGAEGGPGAIAGVVREVSAVTGACLATRRDVFSTLGGFDETLPVSYNDLDYCFRARARGLAVLYSAHATLLHHEGAFRGIDGIAAAEFAAMEARWGRGFVRDPYTRIAPERSAGWAVRQWRRVRWLAGDVIAACRGVGESARALVDGVPVAGVTLLTGDPVARRGRPNHYRLRLVNAGRVPAEIRLEVRGRLLGAGDERSFDAVTTAVLAPASSLDLTCETDWTERFVLEARRPWTWSAVPAPASGRCELVARTRVAGAHDTVLQIEQAVGG